MSSPSEHGEDMDDQQTDPYVDATDDTEEPDYEDDDDEEQDDIDDILQNLIDDRSTEDDDDDEYHDAEDGDDGEADDLFGLIAGHEDEEEQDEEGGEPVDEEQAAENARARIINFIQNFGQRVVFANRAERLNFLRRLNIGDDEIDEPGGWRARMRQRRHQDPFPKVPSEKGRELMNSGVFGANDVISPIRRRKELARRILDREMGIGNDSYRRMNQGVMAQSMLPRTEADMIINYDDPVYSGQFSADGNFFYSCVKDFKVRMYDTSNPYNWRHYKTVSFPFGSWTLTDASLSPDNKWLAYTSIQSNVCLAPTDPNDTGDPYTLSLSEHGARNQGWGRSFGIWSIRFSGDGRELVAGTNTNSIIVYDIETRSVLHSIHGHKDDVNAVCFADKSSPHILYSGSDDKTIKVWDRRSMGDRREAGAFVGHIQGLTYMDSKDDGRYLLSNGKDQSMKLWDLKMMYTTTQFLDRKPERHTPDDGFDYRWATFADEDWFLHPDDNSVVTFRGHRVQRTLIRCHFSPPNSTNSRYVYSGSHDGKVYVWNMDATIAATIDVKKTTSARKSLPRNYRRYFDRQGLPSWGTVVRDASWHPTAPFIAASAFNGWDQQLGTVSLHSYNETENDEGTPVMGTAYDEKLRIVSGDPEEGQDPESDRDFDDDDPMGIFGD
ncbi:WD40-repeat-containing domain protein [Xylariaceae sp. FL1272]|nr:WD40-repeat-containing domain protein [Xylariaceae sp. FL1272]